MSELILVGGPNGAGKTTFIESFLRGEDHTYVGADRIAYEMCPEDVASVAIEAGREFVKRTRQFREEKRDLIVESTLSGRSLAGHVRKLRDAGYFVKLIFVSLPTVNLSVERVRMRVAKGGHDVPKLDLDRRFLKTHQNFWNLYRLLGDRWFLFFNGQHRHELVAGGEGEHYVTIDEVAMAEFLKRAER